MNKKTISLLLSIVLMFSLAVPVAMADGTASVAENCDCGTTTEEHDISCFSRCTCGDALVGDTHLEACPLYTCSVCDGFLNQTGHLPLCKERCNCGDALPDDGTHLEGCELYECVECGALTYQGYVHLSYCSQFICPGCGGLVNQEGVVRSENCRCYYAEVQNSVDGGTSADTLAIAIVDKSREEIAFFNDGVGDYGATGFYKVLTAECPNYLIAVTEYKDIDGQTKYHKYDSVEYDFWYDILSEYFYAEPKNFASVIPAVGLYATLASSGQVLMYKDLAEATNAKPMNLESMFGEYVVADFVNVWKLDVDIPSGESQFFFKLVPTDEWGENTDFVWISADHVVSLSQTPTRTPEPDEPDEPQAPTHSEGCGDECTVEGCTCVCHNALLQRFNTATNLEELDDMVLATTEEEWNTFPEEAWPWLVQLYAERPTSYKIFGATVYDPPVESEVWYPTVNFTNAAPFGTPVTGQ